MKADKETLEKMDKLLNDYIGEVEAAEQEGLLSTSTARTYISHSAEFVKWCKGEFEPGSKNKETR